jgi:hypothetical protein
VPISRTGRRLEAARIVVAAAGMAGAYIGFPRVNCEMEESGARSSRQPIAAILGVTRAELQAMPWPAATDDAATHEDGQTKLSDPRADRPQPDRGVRWHVWEFMGRSLGDDQLVETDAPVTRVALLGITVAGSKIWEPEGMDND